MKLSVSFDLPNLIFSFFMSSTSEYIFSSMATDTEWLNLKHHSATILLDAKRKQIGNCVSALDKQVL